MGKFFSRLGEELSLYVRQIAWLHATPTGQKGKKKLGSRLEQMLADGIEPELPEIPVEYLIDYLFDAGPVSVNGVGGAPLSSAELRAWQDGTGIDLQPWEFRMLRRLSEDYLAESHRAKELACPPPYGTITRNRVLNKRLDEFLS